MKKLLIGTSLFLIAAIANAEAGLPICSGTSKIAASNHSSKLFMTLADGQKVQYSNEYGRKGTTVFKFKGKANDTNAFNVGNTVTYKGVLDQSTICVPSTLTIKL